MRTGALKDWAQRLRAIPLEAVLRHSGAQPDRYDPHKWHTGQGVLSVTGTQFMNWHCGRGGGGAIDLVMHLHDLGFKAALHWLGQVFPGSWPREAEQRDPSLPPVPLALPPPDSAQLGCVRRYLVQERRLPAGLVESLIQSGSLYADRRANAVFLLLGKENQPVGAELRGTTARPWHGLAPGSQKDLGCFAIPAADRPALILVESAIDAISCLALHPEHRCLSTAGARPNPCWLAPLIDQGHRVYCGFDADAAGENMAHALIRLHPAVVRLRPSLKDWNDMLKARA